MYDMEIILTSYSDMYDVENFWQVRYREYSDLYDTEDILTPYFDIYGIDSDILF